MRNLKGIWHNLRIKWKLTIGAAFIFFVLFSSFNFFQYQIVNHWVKILEKNNLERSASDVVTFINTQKNWSDQSLSTLKNNLSQLSDRNELIQLYKSNGQLITQVANTIPTSWVALRPQSSRLIWSVKKHKKHLIVVQRTFKSENLSGSLIIAKNMDMYDNLLQIIRKIMLLGGLGALIISLLTGLLLSGQLLKPIKNLKTTIERIQRKGLHERVELSGYEDELTSLSFMFNDMMDKVEATFSVQKQFVEDASHELRTPLSILEGHLSLINRWGKDDRTVLEESLNTSLHEMKRIKGLVNDLLDLSKIEDAGQLFMTEEIEWLDPLPILKRMVQDFRLLYGDFAFQLESNTVNSVNILINEYHFEQLITILLDNAIKYSKDKKEVGIQLGKKDNQVLVAIKDWGIGIPRDEIEHIFNRFYRVDKARSRKNGGNGIGLSIAKRLVQSYKGDLVIESEEGVGTIATVIFKQAGPPLP